MLWGLLGWLELLKAWIMDSDETAGEIVFISVATSIHDCYLIRQAQGACLAGYL